MSWNAGQVVNISVTPDDDDTRLDRWLKRQFHGLSQIQIEKALRKGEIRVDGARVKSNTRLKSGQSVRVPPMAPRPDANGETAARTTVKREDAEFIRSLVIYEDERIIAINKPPGIAVQGGTGTHRHIDGMSRALVGPEAEKPRLVHRLDRDTSGILVLAKSAGTAASLGKLFRSRTMEKIYWAVVLGVPNPTDGELRGWMIKSSGPGEDKEKMRPARHGEFGSVHAVTLFSTLANAGQRASWVALKPETGRTHQLRFHMAEIGNAIVGDRKYTCDIPTPGGLGEGMHLHARAIKLPPYGTNKKPTIIKADMPDHMLETFDALGFEASLGNDPFFALKRVRK